MLIVLAANLFSRNDRFLNGCTIAYLKSKNFCLIDPAMSTTHQCISRGVFRRHKLESHKIFASQDPFLGINAEGKGQRVVSWKDQRLIGDCVADGDLP